MLLIILSFALSADVPTTTYTIDTSTDVVPSKPIGRDAELLWLVAYDPIGFIEKVEANGKAPAATWMATSPDAAIAITQVCGMRLTGAPTTVTSCELASACGIQGKPDDALRVFCGSCQAVYPYRELPGCGKISRVPPTSLQYLLDTP